MKAWRPFIERLLVSLSAQTNACFLLFGKVAWSFKDCIFDNDRGVFMEYHPAYYARNNTPMPNIVWKQMLEYVQENYGVTLKLYE
jgi:uracil DNA glycosylase